MTPDSSCDVTEAGHISHMRHKTMFPHTILDPNQKEPPKLQTQDFIQHLYESDGQNLPAAHT